MGHAIEERSQPQVGVGEHQVGTPGWQAAEASRGDCPVCRAQGQGQTAQGPQVAAGGQSRRLSALESIANVTTGYGIAVAAQMAIFPWFGVHLPLGDNLLIGAFFTVISLIRGYALRRLFNAWSKAWPCA
jgi:hypothetical protein